MEIKQIKNHGFIEPEIQEEDYVLGDNKLGAVSLQPDGQWDDFLPVEELQRRNGLETSNCTVYGTLNCLECLYKRLFSEDRNFSERYIGVVTETQPAGNNVQKIIEIIRKEAGLIPEKLLPFSDDINTWNEYYSPKPMTEKFLLIGKNWLNFHNVGHEWLFNRYNKNKPRRLKEALRYSPVGVSVLAWIKDGEYYTKEPGAWDNHWVMCYGYVEGKYWKIYDHYNDTKKRLRWDYDFGFAKRYSLSKRVETEPTKESILDNIERALEIIRKELENLRLKIQKKLGKIFKR